MKCSVNEYKSSQSYPSSQFPLKRLIHSIIIHNINEESKIYTEEITGPGACDDILVGYLLGFLLFATIQTAVILAFTIYALQMDYQGNTFEVVALLTLVVLVAMNLGNFVSTFARNDSRLCSSFQ